MRSPFMPIKRSALTCTCKKSQCLKLYCHCFAASTTCGDSCSCADCRNTVASASDIMKARDRSFHRKTSPLVADIRDYRGVARIASPLLLDHGSHSHYQANERPYRGKTIACKCRKSLCLKKYCECFSGSLFCSPTCRCMDCKNTPGAVHSDSSERSDSGSGCKIQAAVSSQAVALSDDDNILAAALAITELMSRPTNTMHSESDREMTTPLDDPSSADIRRDSHDMAAVLMKMPSKRYRTQLHLAGSSEKEFVVKKPRFESIMSLQTRDERMATESRNPSPIAFKKPLTLKKDRYHQNQYMGYYQGNRQVGYFSSQMTEPKPQHVHRSQFPAHMYPHAQRAIRNVPSRYQHYISPPYHHERVGYPKMPSRSNVGPHDSHQHSYQPSHVGRRPFTNEFLDHAHGNAVYPLPTIVFQRHAKDEDEVGSDSRSSTSSTLTTAVTPFKATARYGEVFHATDPMNRMQCPPLTRTRTDSTITTASSDCQPEQLNIEQQSYNSCRC